MSLFCITSSNEAALVVENDYNKVFPEKAFTYQIEDKLFVTITTGFVKKNVCKKIGGNYIFIIGTIFSEIGFIDEILEHIDDYDDFMKSIFEIPQRLFGHYIVIGYHEKTQCLKIITDRIGCLNVYYTVCPNDDICIGNDLIEISKISKNHKVECQAAEEFIMMGSNVNEKTVFQNVLRLSLGKCLVYDKKGLQVSECYKYQIEYLDKKQYVQRINKYFSYLNKYKGRIGVDLSGGMDTRLIVSIAYSVISSLMGFCVNNQSDDGIDKELSKIIAERLELQCIYLDYMEFPDFIEQRELMYHGTSVLRDAERSKRWPILFSQRFKTCDLSLGGYGGEILRAKYNKYADIEQFIGYYCKGAQAEKFCGMKEYQKEVMEELMAYPVSGIPTELIQNWYYAVSKMRIWGSAFLQMSSLYGDVIHPFMDWYLMGPIFGFPLKELENGKMQKEIIEMYAHQLNDIPFNEHIYNRGNGCWSKKIIRSVIAKLKKSKVAYSFLHLQRKICYVKERKRITLQIGNVWTENNDLVSNIYCAGTGPYSRLIHIVRVQEKLNAMLNNVQ